MGLAPAESRFDFVEERHAFDAGQALGYILDQAFEVLGRVCTREKLQGILIIRVGTLLDHIPEVGSEDGIGQFARQDLMAGFTTVKNGWECGWQCHSYCCSLILV